jgi:hypothetical protein
MDSLISVRQVPEGSRKLELNCSDAASLGSGSQERLHSRRIAHPFLFRITEASPLVARAALNYEMKKLCQEQKCGPA